MSAGVAVEVLNLSLGAFNLKSMDFAVSHNEILVILGPNGSGKSVTLETIAGFHRPDSGRVLIGGRDVTALPPERRNIGFVVQNFGLFPHLSVAQNVAIARRHDRPHAVRDRTLPPFGDPGALLGYFGITHLADRAPSGLSPGEKQRVALARALAGAPDLFLFDEPFSALDAETRAHLRDELKSFLRAMAIPAIFVSHDRGDAMTLADTIAILRDGGIVQIGPAAEIFRKPANSFVARFVGVANILSGRIAESSGTAIAVEVGKHILHAQPPAAPPRPGSAILLSIHAEDVALPCPSPAQSEEHAVNSIEGRVSALHSEGPLVTVDLDCGLPLKAYLLARQVRDRGLAVGCAVGVRIAPEAIHLMTG
jgi:molybdate/tungstate transport system ATP-binding protein